MQDPNNKDILLSESRLDEFKEQLELDYIEFLESEGIEHRDFETNGIPEYPLYEWQTKPEFQKIFDSPDLMAQELGFIDFEDYIKEEGEFSC
jgi:hypothetical protein